MQTRLFAIALALCLAGPALAQAPPFTYPQTIGAASVQILAANAQRKKLIFHNPNDVAKIAVCPVGPTRAVGGSQSLIVAVINGAGCITLLPYQTQEVVGAVTSGQQQAISSAWVGIASAGGSAITVLEFE